MFDSRRFSPTGQFSSHFNRVNLKPATFTAVIKDDAGNVVFEQPGFMAPASWSQRAVNITAQKYARGSLDKMADRESSVFDIVNRVVNEIRNAGLAGRYFMTEEEANNFSDDLYWVLLAQYGSFNSPVWFNLGVEKEPQCSACFILGIEDDMAHIGHVATAEMRIYKYGSGSGKNISALRSSKEYVTHGGLASGPCSFEKGYDAFAGIIKSGGKTRRAAKMVILNVDHPDIFTFVRMKTHEKEKAEALIAAGYSGGMNGEAFGTVAYQNLNASVGVTDAFMEAAMRDERWPLRAVTTGETVEEVSALDLFHEIAKNAHAFGCPGLQFLTTQNDWNMVGDIARIVATNPCAEFVFIDDTACNLASVNFLKFLLASGVIDIEAFEYVCRLFITAQEIIVGRSAYPTKEIAENSHRMRPLGLGGTNVGALLMAMGLPYGSESGRMVVASMTALMTGAAYDQSTVLAKRVGPCEAWHDASGSAYEVLEKHYKVVKSRVESGECREESRAAFARAYELWTQVVATVADTGLRNMQTTLYAPTGTISFMMDCDTTGVEPEIALVKKKVLAGGGSLRMVNQTVERALTTLGYSRGNIDLIVRAVGNGESIFDHISEEHHPVFYTAFPHPKHPDKVVGARDHLLMMAAIQPLISGSISKTVNLPSTVTVGEVAKIYEEAWRLGLKNIAIYRDGCRTDQPVTVATENESQDEGTKKDPDGVAPVEAEVKTMKAGFRLSDEMADYLEQSVDVMTGLARGERERLPDERDNAITVKFKIGGTKGYFTVGHFDDDQTRPAELFIVLAKNGSALRGWADAFAVVFSMALQYGVPLDKITSRMMDEHFAPAGLTNLDGIPIAHSIVDMIMRWMRNRYINKTTAPLSLSVEAEEPTKTAEPEPVTDAVETSSGRTGFCPVCGGLTYPRGRCMVCESCGETDGCS